MRVLLRPTPTLAAALTVAPVVVATVLALAQTYAFLEALDGRTWLLARQVQMGEAAPGAVAELGRFVRNMVVFETALGVLATLGAVLAAGLGLQALRRRLDALHAYLADHVRGGSATAPTPDASLLGAVEAEAVRLVERMDERETELHQEMEMRRYSAEVQQALEMAMDEDDVHAVIEQAARMVLPEASLQLLLADSSRAHLRTVIGGLDRGGEEDVLACRVRAPHGCPAIRESRFRAFPSSARLSACPRLRECPASPCAALCLPLNIMGRAVGVLHLRLRGEHEFDESTAQILVSLATHAAARLGMLRTLQSTEVQASTDPLTGLLNRRSFEEAAEALLASDNTPSLVMFDLDHFKRLNDTFGHQAGDRALRLFARVLERGIKRDDLACRLGGEEFVVLLRDCTSVDAVRVVDRIRDGLERALSEATVPPFTFSAGIASVPEHCANLEKLLHLADAALYSAKRQGRNRTVLAGTEADHLCEGCPRWSPEELPYDDPDEGEPETPPSRAA